MKRHICTPSAYTARTAGGYGIIPIISLSTSRPTQTASMVQHWWHAKHQSKAEALAQQSTKKSIALRSHSSSDAAPPKFGMHKPLPYPDHPQTHAAGPYGTQQDAKLAEHSSHLPPHQSHTGRHWTPPMDLPPELHITSQMPAGGNMHHAQIRALPTPPPHVDMQIQSYLSTISQPHGRAAQLPYKPSTMCHKAPQRVAFGKDCTGEVIFACSNNAPHHGSHMMVCADTKITVPHNDPALLHSTTRGSRCPCVMTLKCERQRNNHHALHGAHLVYHAAEGFFYVRTPGDKDFHRLHQHKP